MKQIQIIIPDRGFIYVNDILKEAKVGGLSHYKIEGRGGGTRAKEVAVGRGTMRYTPEFIPRTKVEVVVKDEQVEAIITKIGDELSTANIDGKIFVIDVPIAVDIATKSRGETVI
jgi:nitrogen regulatory protein P-II 1